MGGRPRASDGAEAGPGPGRGASDREVAMNPLEELGPGCGQMGHGGGSGGMERRGSPRYSSVPNWATATWRDGRGKQVASMRVIDVGVGGMLVSSTILPRVGQMVRVRLEQPVTTDWYEAEVARLDPPDLFAVVFPDNCPYDLYRAVRGLRRVSDEVVVEWC